MAPQTGTHTLIPQPSRLRNIITVYIGSTPTAAAIAWATPFSQEEGPLIDARHNAKPQTVDMPARQQLQRELSHGDVACPR